jgi:hypothetical protein
MPEEMIQMHHVLGISDERSKEIAKEILDTLTEAGMVDAGTKKLAEKYDAESILVGMRLLQAIQLNDSLEEKRSKGQAFVEAFGQNADSN